MNKPEDHETVTSCDNSNKTENALQKRKWDRQTETEILIFISIWVLRDIFRGRWITIEHRNSDWNLEGVPWIHEHLTVEWSANFPDWSIRYQWRSRTFAANERNSNNNSLKEKMGKMTKNRMAFQMSQTWGGWSDGNGLNGAEECWFFSATQGPLERAIHHELVAMLQENAVSYSSVMRFYSAGRRFWAWIRKKPDQPSSPKDEDLDEVNEAILLALSDEPSSSVPSVRQIARRICVPKSIASIVSRRLVDSRHFRVRNQKSDIFIRFLTCSLTVRRQLESNCRSNLATPAVYPASRRECGYILPLDES
jgi:hypothetical protein